MKYLPALLVAFAMLAFTGCQDVAGPDLDAQEVETAAFESDADNRSDDRGQPRNYIPGID